MKKGIIRAALRGILKGFPAINAAIESVQNFKAKNETVLKNEVNEVVNPNEVENIKELPHSWLSIILQVATSATLIYLVATKKIEVDKFYELIKYFF